MKTSLTWRFIVIFIIIVLSALILYWKPLNYGIDLAGGTSLLYELDLSKQQNLSSKELQDLANRVVEVLKKRVDPLGQKNLIWRVIGDKRIQVQMPRANKATLEARKEETAAREALQKSLLKLSEVQRIIALPEPARTQAINALAPKESESVRNDRIVALAAASDKVKAAEAEAAKYRAGETPESVLMAVREARKAYDAAQVALEQTNVPMGKLLSTLTAADSEGNTTARDNLKSIAKEAGAQKPLVERLIAAHQKLIELSGGGVDDPNDLKRMVTTTGVLDFRIAVTQLSGEDAPADLRRNSDDFNTAVQSLKLNGPTKSIPLLGTTVRWMGVDPKGLEGFGWKTGSDAEQATNRFVMAEYDGLPWLLCFDDNLRTLTHNRELPWNVTASAPAATPEGVLSLPFQLDTIGAKYMGRLTSDNLKRPMAILLDDKAMSAPIIQAHITNAGTITFGSNRSPEEVRKEAEALRGIIDSGSLPAALQREPISEQEITPDLGADNINAGFRSGIYALIAVMGFMVLYYTVTGFFANLALGLNLLLVLAVMASLGGTFTLPGIAGLVLTLGMAVDANILINERIREEIHKGASLWMSVKQGYDKVFWTIFDANLTTSLTAFVLYLIGSEEVKGFGLTLLIGLTIHMFTALFVTRTLMMWAIRIGIIRAIDDHSIGEYIREIFTFTWLRSGHFPFMRVITVTNIDWIGKRYIFWTISSVLVAAGIVVFIIRGEDRYDIEFRGGTQVTFALKQLPAGSTYLDLADVRKRIYSLADYVDPETNKKFLTDLGQARVYGVGGADKHTFEMQTTVKNPEGQGDFVKKKLLEPLANKFKDVLKSMQRVTADGFELNEDGRGYKYTDKQINDLIDVLQIVRPITAPTLDQVFAKTKFEGLPARDVSDQAKGVAILLNNINPPLTASDLEARIKQTRGSEDPDIKKIPNRNSRVIPLIAVGPDGKPVEATENDDRPLTRAVVVSVDEAHRYVESAETDWRLKVAATEWTIMQGALARESLFQGVTTFDAVLANKAKTDAVTAIVLSLMLIVVYVWIRFGGIRYGIGAIVSLMHNAILAVAATVAAKYLAETRLGHFLLLEDFKINLTMIAAYLTVIGYSVNDTIVIFDRVRELRGKSQAPLSAKLINEAINKCFGRTVWTTFTVFIVVLIMYIWGGTGIRGFAYAMLIGVLGGAYSTLAIASPMLLAASSSADKANANKPQTKNPFLRSTTDPR
ncbi:MAG: protein translocase subunit SecD [Phycisphaerales bacterium]|nr:protein translocase subunit SecD [Phycisphaerales bacterium]